VASQLANWEEQVQENSLMWAWTLTKSGAWSYLAMTAVGCLGLEYTLMKFSGAWARVLSSIQSMIGMPESQAYEAGFYGYDQDGQPVYDPTSPIAYDVDGQVVAYEEAGPASADSQASRVTPEAATAGAQGETFPPFREANGYHQEPPPSNPGHPPLWDPAAPEAAASESAAAEPARETPARSETLHDVIGGAAGEKVTLDQALADQRRYWVDPEGPHVWDAQYRETLFGEELKKAA